MDDESDHVHLLINYPPKLAVSSFVNSLKGISSRLLRRDRPDIASRYYYKGVLWTPGYFAGSCGGASISIIRQYIEQHQTPIRWKTAPYIPAPNDGLLRRTGKKSHVIRRGLNADISGC